MDRSRITASGVDIRFVTGPAQCGGATVVLVDIGRNEDAVSEVRALAPRARIIAFGPHEDTDAFARARAGGADLVLPRSRFFHDVVSAIYTSGQG